MARNKLSTVAQRVLWLVDHKELWYKWYSAIPNDNLLQQLYLSNGKRNLVRAMQLDGLFSKKTYWMDCKLKVELHQAMQIIQLRRLDALRLPKRTKKSS